MKRRLPTRLMLAFPFWLVLSACGGGGSGADTSVPAATGAGSEAGGSPASGPRAETAVSESERGGSVADPGSGHQSATETAFPTVLTAANQVTVRARVEGEVASVRREEGQRVSPGDVLAVLDASRYRIALDRAAAEAQKARLTYQNKAQLRGQGIAENEVRIAEADYRIAQADSALRHLELEHTTIRAPIGGFISERRVRTGQWVAVQEPVYTIVDPTELWAVAFVPPYLLTELEPGDPVRVGVEVDGRRRIVEGHLHLRSPVSDPGSGRIRITVRISNTDGRLTPGMPAHLIFPTP